MRHRPPASAAALRTCTCPRVIHSTRKEDDCPAHHCAARRASLGRTQALFPEYQVYALLANLAVAPSTRRSGLARVLCDKCEEAGAEWGVQAIMLQVEEANSAAKALYEKVGYSLVHKDESASALRVQPGKPSGQLLRSESSTLLLLGKGLAPA